MRIDHVARQDQGGLFEEGVDVRRVGIGHQQHVRCFDTLPAGDRRTVEGVARGELVFVEMGNGHGNVLFFATGVSEAEVNELNFVVLHDLHHVGDGLVGHQVLLARGVMWMQEEKLSLFPDQKQRAV